MVILLLQKGIKSLQLRINEYLDSIAQKNITSLTGSAFTQARKKLSYTAFKELNRRCIVQTFYEGKYNVWEELRILAIDGSKVRLPLEEEIQKEFGVKKNANSSRKPEYCEALASVLYDVGNRIVLDSSIETIRKNERESARKHLEVLKENEDLVIYDRGYMGYPLFALHSKKQVHFLCRCKKDGFKEAQELFEEGCLSITKIARVIPCKRAKRKMKEWDILDNDLMQNITIRFVRVILKTGEIEVLVTSLLDEDKYPNEVFKDLYYERWGAETYYDIIKNRLTLENFSGKSVESVRQDFFSTILLTNLESVISKTPEDRLREKKGNQYPQKVNKAVSFNALKNKAYQLLISEEGIENILDKLEQLFLSNPTIVRKGREPPRKKVRDHDRVQFLKHSRKHCF